MVQPKYSPEEALQRIKLMMKYDSSKTLNENVQTIEERTGTGEVALGAGTTGALGGAALGGTALSSSTALAAPVTTALGGSAYAATSVGYALGAGSATAAATIGGAVIGGVAALALAPLAYWLITKDTGANKVKKFFEMCSSEGAKIAKLERKIDDRTLRDMSDNINDAVNYSTWGFLAGTDEEKLFDQFRALQDGTASDFCALVNQYNKNYGDLWDDLDGDIDAEDEWNQIFRPLRNCVEDSLLTIADETEQDCKSNPDQKKCQPLNKIQGGGYTVCTGMFTKGCKTEPEGAVGKVQACLGGLVKDGKFGPKTEAKLREKAPEFAGGFRENEVEKICSKVASTTSVSGATPEVEKLASDTDEKIASLTEPF